MLTAPRYRHALAPRRKNLSCVIPELIFGGSMFSVFTTIFPAVHPGALAEVPGLVTWNASWAAIVVQGRLVTIGRQYEEAAAGRRGSPAPCTGFAACSGLACRLVQREPG
jgi:ABC-type spermidine/putrescine transport system permease subunit II